MRKLDGNQTVTFIAIMLFIIFALLQSFPVSADTISCDPPTKRINGLDLSVAELDSFVLCVSSVDDNRCDLFKIENSSCLFNVDNPNIDAWYSVKAKDINGLLSEFSDSIRVPAINPPNSPNNLQYNATINGQNCAINIINNYFECEK